MSRNLRLSGKYQKKKPQMKTNNQLISKTIIIAIIVACFAFNVQAATGHVASDTTKMSKMKTDKKMSKKKPSKMKKDTTSKM